MDIIRSHLDELMGKDRNITNEERAKKKEHYDDPDVNLYFIYYHDFSKKFKLNKFR
jgi:hypothetical protein